MAVNKKDAAAGLASAVALISGAQIANAADADVGPAGFDWSGFYVGIGAGIQAGDMPLSYDNDYNMNSDIAFGAFAGVNHQYGDFVVGAELALQTGNETDDGDDGDDYDVRYTADAKLKLGMVAGAEDQALIYAFGGFFSSGISTYDGDYDYSSYGANFGAGLEYMLTEDFSLGVEVMARAPIDEYGWTDAGNEAGLSYQGTLRAAFHF